MANKIERRSFKLSPDYIKEEIERQTKSASSFDLDPLDIPDIEDASDLEIFQILNGTSHHDAYYYDGDEHVVHHDICSELFDDCHLSSQY